MSDTGIERRSRDFLTAFSGAAAFLGVDPGLVGMFTLVLQRQVDRQADNLAGTVREFERCCADVPDDVFTTSINRPVFGDLCRSVLPSALRAESEPRRRQLARVLEAGLRADDATTARLQAVAHVLESIDELGVLWLRFYERGLTMTEARAFFEQHPYLLQGPVTMAMPHAERMQSYLAGVSRDRLYQQGLLTARPQRFPMLGESDVERRSAHVLRQLVKWARAADSKGDDAELTDFGRLVLHVVRDGYAGLKGTDAAGTD